MTVDAARLPHRAVLGFAIGSLGAGVYSTVPTVLLLFYCTEVLRLAPAVAATIVFVPKAWAILWDPFVGLWSDRTRGARGRRAPFILAGTLGVTVTFAMLFNAPTGAGSGTTVAYVMLVYFLMATAYSLFAVPYVAIPAEISPLASERERLMFWRMVFAMLGVLVGAGIAPHLVEIAGGGHGGYSVMGFEIAIACGLAMLVSFATVRNYHGDDRPDSTRQGVERAGLRRLIANRDYLRLWVSYVLAISGASLLLALVPYYVTQVMGYGEGDAGTALLVLLAGTIISLPMWSRLLARWGGWSAYALAIGSYIALAAIFAFLPPQLELRAVVPVFFALGLPFGGMQLLSFTLLAHIAHADAQLGARQEGLYTGLWTAGEKLSLAIGPAAAGLGLALAGYVPGAAAQSAETLSGLQLAMGLGPAVFMLPTLALCIGRVSTPAGQVVQ